MGDRGKARLFGILLYVLSDTLIAVNKFVINSENTWALHMATYFMAQFLLTDSSLVPLSKQVSAQKANNNNSRGLGSRSLSSDMTAFMRAWWRANGENQATNTTPNNPPHPTYPNTNRNTTNTRT